MTAAGGETRSGGEAGRLRAGLAAMEVRLRDLAAPVLLTTATGLLRIVGLALWLPLLHGILAGELRLGRRLRFLDGVLPDDADHGWVLAALAAAIVAVHLAKAFVSYRAQRAVDRRSDDAEQVLAAKVVRRHLRFGQSWYDAAGPARTVRNVQRLPSRAARLPRWLVRATAKAVEIVLYAGLMVWLSPWLGAVALVVMSVYYLLLRRHVERVEERIGEEEELEDEADADVHDLAANLLLLRLSAPEEETVDAFRRNAERRSAVRQRRRATLDLLDEVREGANVLLLLAFVLAVGWAIQRIDVASVSRYLVFFFVFRRAMGSFSTLQRLPQQWRNLAQHVDALRAVLGGDEALVPAGDRPLPPVAEGVEVRRLDFAYGDGEPVLSEVSLTARRGELTVLVGPNGCGKSTLVQLLLRLYDAPPGALLIDGADARDFDLGSLRSRTAYAASEPMLLDASLRDNLTVGLPPAGEERLRAACDLAGLAPLVELLQGGLDHPIGRAGLRLSQGQRQRVALARVVLRDADLVLLDEATSSLDPASERAVMRRLVEHAADRVVVAVTHRVASIPPTAHVVVLDAGRVVESGPCAELAVGRGPFRHLRDAGRAGDAERFTAAAR